MANDLYDRLLHDLIVMKNRDENYKTAKQELWAIVSVDQQRYLEMFFHNWFNANWSRDTTVKPYKPRNKPSPEQIKERRKEDANLRGTAMMNWFLPDGETRLKNATGAQLDQLGGWFKLIRKYVKPNEIVGKKLTAEQLFNLWSQTEGKKAA